MNQNLKTYKTSLPPLTQQAMPFGFVNPTQGMIVDFNFVI
jgi:hypothetical protein